MDAKTVYYDTIDRNTTVTVSDDNYSISYMTVSEAEQNDDIWVAAASR